MSEAMTIVGAGRPQLEYLPVGLFGAVMGLTGPKGASWRGYWPAPCSGSFGGELRTLST